MAIHRGLVVLGLGAACIVFIIAALGTNLMVGSTNNGANKIYVTVWYKCYTSPGSDTQCQQTNDNTADLCSTQVEAYQALQAFYCLSAIFAVVAMIVANVEAFVAQQKKFVLTAAILPLFIFTLVAWGTAVAIPREHFCGVESPYKQGYMYGPTAGLMLIAWFITLLMIGASIALPGKDEAAAPAAEAAAPAAVTVTATSAPETAQASAPAAHAEAPAATADKEEPATAANEPIA